MNSHRHPQHGTAMTEGSGVEPGMALERRVVHPVATKDKTTAGLLAIFLGGFGVHKFYLGQTGAGIVYLMFFWTFIPALISLFEGLSLISMSPEQFNARYAQHLLPAPQQNIVVHVSNQSAASAQPPFDLAGQLKALHDLKLAGALTEEEFQEQKRKLLER